MLFCLIVEDTVVAMSVTGILKVWIITAEVSRMQVNCRLQMLSFKCVHLFCVRAIHCVCSGLGPSVWRRIQTRLLSGLSEHFLLHLHSEEPVGHLFQILEGKRLCDYHSHLIYFVTYEICSFHVNSLCSKINMWDYSIHVIEPHLISLHCYYGDLCPLSPTSCYF